MPLRARCTVLRVQSAVNERCVRSGGCRVTELSSMEECGSRGLPGHAAGLESELALPDGRRVRIGLAPHEHAGTGYTCVWPPATALCRWLCSVAHALKGARILELGSGAGACGLFAAALGASRVLLTDVDEPALLALARSNVEKNAALLPADTSVDVQGLVWGSVAPEGPWDWIIGSDITYVARGMERLCQTVRQVLERAAELGCTPPRVILAHQDRPEVRGGADGSLSELTVIAAEHELEVQQLFVDRDPNHGYPPVPIALLEICFVCAARGR